jgi:hypothetical protein
LIVIAALIRAFSPLFLDFIEISGFIAAQALEANSVSLMPRASHCMDISDFHRL